MTSPIVTTIEPLRLETKISKYGSLLVMFDIAWYNAFNTLFRSSMRRKRYSGIKKVWEPKIPVRYTCSVEIIFCSICD